MRDFDDISVNLNNHIATITIQRPPNNFFDSFLIQQIADAYVELDEIDDCRVILLCSEGKNFCAGANFGEDKDMHNKSHPYSKLYDQAVRLFRTNKPVVAVVQGAAVGGGLGLALSADFRIACPEARFSANFAKLGFHPGFGSSVTLPRVVGLQNSADMLYTARRVKGEEALEMGLVDKITSKETLMDDSIKFASEIASSAPMAIESIRSTLKGDLADRVEEVVAWELSEQIRLQKTEDFKEGIASSLERRDPKFSRK
ncbi:MAG: enoyl-CoA hydratase [Gammaproteobacteria bacterium]|nr:enoyl-CoA hydratase [Gammaproteobacteria bacterium]|tara:strand:+ start:1184 stop:1957 length:774 start_codon:yes stop_codon:yes gene_type:complete